jgi:hypothetical protein
MNIAKGNMHRGEIPGLKKFEPAPGLGVEARWAEKPVQEFEE